MLNLRDERVSDDGPVASARKEDFFEDIDPFDNPLALLSGDYQGQRMVLSPATAANLRREMKDHPERRYNMARTLDSHCGTPGYEAALGLQERSFSGLVAEYCRLTGRSALSVMVAGCGNAFAAEQIFDTAEVDRQRSLGITVHSLENVCREVADRILQIDMATVGPKWADEDFLRFDVLVSVVGAVHYHPLNKDIGRKHRKMFGVLQAINFLREQGLLCVTTENLLQVDLADYDSISLLISMGILRRVSEFERFARPRAGRFDSRQTIGTLALVLDRRPQLEEIRKLLGLENWDEQY